MNSCIICGVLLKVSELLSMVDALISSRPTLMFPGNAVVTRTAIDLCLQSPWC